MSFMLAIDAARPGALDQLAIDYCYAQKLKRPPSLDFCRQVCGVPDKDEVIARRLGVTVLTVRTWREVGRRSSWGCR
jgi:hypothetical protein